MSEGKTIRRDVKAASLGNFLWIPKEPVGSDSLLGAEKLTGRGHFDFYYISEISSYGSNSKH